ncbi:MAG: hypothetical protein ACO3HP_06625 [Candidatus Nanopelagicaceae bacterium]
MAKFPVGTIVDLYDFGFRQWRGEYIVIKTPDSDRALYKIRNTKTNSQQFVKEKALRIGRLGPFSIESLRP